MEQQVIDDILHLRVQGYSIRDIAAELGIKKWQIERILNEHRTEIEEMIANVPDEPDTDATPAPDQQTADTIRQLETLHKEILKEKEDLEKRKMEMQRLLELSPNKQQIIEEFRRKNREEKLVSRTNRLLNEVLNNCNDCTWSDDDIDDFLERCENVKDRIKAFCDANDIDERKLLVYQALDFIISDIEEEKEKSRSGIFGIFANGVTLHYSDEYQRKIRSYLVSDFHQTAPSDSVTQTADDEWTKEDDD